jgi:hypothetical protein
MDWSKVCAHACIEKICTREEALSIIAREVWDTHALVHKKWLKQRKATEMF